MVKDLLRDANFTHGEIEPRYRLSVRRAEKVWRMFTFTMYYIAREASRAPGRDLRRGVVHARVDQIVTLTSKLDNPEGLKLSRGQNRNLRRKLGLGEVWGRFSGWRSIRWLSPL